MQALAFLSLWSWTPSHGEDLERLQASWPFLTVTLIQAATAQQLVIQGQHCAIAGGAFDFLGPGRRLALPLAVMALERVRELGV